MCIKERYGIKKKVEYMSCEVGLRNKDDIQDLFKMVEARNAEVHEMKEGQIKICLSLDGMKKTLYAYMEEGLEFRAQVKKNTIVRMLFIALIAFIGTIGSVAGAIWMVMRLLNL